MEELFNKKVDEIRYIVEDFFDNSERRGDAYTLKDGRFLADRVGFEVKNLLDVYHKELVGIIIGYEKFCRKEFREAEDKNLVMLAYDMHSRLVAIKHILEKLIK